MLKKRPLVGEAYSFRKDSALRLETDTYAPVAFPPSFGSSYAASCLVVSPRTRHRGALTSGQMQFRKFIRLGQIQRLIFAININAHVRFFSSFYQSSMPFSRCTWCTQDLNREWCCNKKQLYNGAHLPKRLDRSIKWQLHATPVRRLTFTIMKTAALKDF